jgi:uncharacterized protein YuzB (UPF0349 family)
MEKNTELVEFFVCPHCKGISWELVDFIPFESSSEYSCLAECDHCGEEVLMVDYVSRCTKCELKVECMAMPLKLTYCVAGMIRGTTTAVEIKKFLIELERHHGV